MYWPVFEYDIQYSIEYAKLITLDPTVVLHDILQGYL